jgi:biotin carboxylase
MPGSPLRLLLLLPTTTYRTQDFLDAGRKLGVEIVSASEHPSTFEERLPDHLVTLDFTNPMTAADRMAAFARTHPIDAVVAVDDATTVVAAAIAERLGLKANPVAAARATRNKREMRERLRAAGVPQPRYWPISLDADPERAAEAVDVPCVLKPLGLSASRGVIRADDDKEFVAAFHRIAAILRRDDVTVSGEAARWLLAEEFIPGREVAVEGLLADRTFHPLAIFDKPDPLDGPFFEETIYVTPSRLPAQVQRDIVTVTEQGCAALGLSEGPVHGELRVNDRGPWVIEIAARSIGGLCSRTLRFGTGMSLEELILRSALALPITTFERERQPAGVMMIPIPKAGRLTAVRGQEAAQGVPGIEEVTITAHREQELVALPEGWQYLGFIFARADTPAAVERALREAHAHLAFEIR